MNIWTKKSVPIIKKFIFFYYRVFNGKPALTCHAVVLQPGTAALLQVLQQVDLTRRGFETLEIPKHKPSNVTDGHAKRFQISGTICHHRENVWNELVCFSFFIDSLPGPGKEQEPVTQQ